MKKIHTQLTTLNKHTRGSTHAGSQIINKWIIYKHDTQSMWTEHFMNKYLTDKTFRCLDIVGYFVYLGVQKICTPLAVFIPVIW